MALTKRGKLRERVKRQEAYLEYFRRMQRAGLTPMTLYKWRRRRGLKPTVRTRTTLRRLRKEAGLTEKEIKKITR